MYILTVVINYYMNVMKFIYYYNMKYIYIYMHIYTSFVLLLKTFKIDTF